MSWWNSTWQSLEPETAASIRSQPPQPKSWGTMWACGCEESNKTEPMSLHICLWHEGYDEAMSQGRFSDRAAQDEK